MNQHAQHCEYAETLPIPTSRAYLRQRMETMPLCVVLDVLSEEAARKIAYLIDDGLASTFSALSASRGAL